MAEASVSRRLLVEAVAALEAQSDTVEGDEELVEAIQIALDVLRHRLAAFPLANQPDTNSLAVLVADLSGFTALAERLDAERVQAAIHAMWQVLDAVVTSWGGQVELHAGDSLVGLFGHPIRRRDDIERALYAALTIQQELALFNKVARGQDRAGGGREWAAVWPGPEMRIGVHAGPLTITQPEAGRQRIVVGETWRVAQSLEDRADPGEVLASPVVWQAAKSAFHMEPVSSADDAAIAYRVLAPHPVATPDSLPRGDDLPLLAGRRDELDVLEQRFQQVVEAQAIHTVLMLAEAGSGKSRLIHELEQHLRVIHGPIAVLRARATTPAAPFALIRELLAHRLELRPQYSRSLKSALIEDALAAIRGTEVLPGDTQAPDQAAVLLGRLLTPEGDPDLSFDEIAAANETVLRIIAGDNPTLLVLEDIHLADRSTLDLVEALCQTPRPLRLLILATADPSIDRREVVAELSWLAAHDDPFSPHARLNLPPLSPVDSRLLATSMLGVMSPAPLRLIDLLVAEAGGNPLHIQQLIDLYIASGVIRTGDRWVADMDKAEQMRLPRDLPELIRQRVAHLSAAERQLLEAGAVMGDTFWDVALARMVPDVFDMPAIDALLGGLVAGGWLAPEMTADLGAARAYRFQRRVVAEALANGLPPTERRRLHRRAAVWLRSLPQALEQRSWLPLADLAAWHARQGASDVDTIAPSGSVPGEFDEQARP